MRVDGQELMNSASHRSEEKLAVYGCASLAGKPGVRVLLGGLGMGFTARAALDVLAGDAEVVVVESVAAVVRWNRDVLGHLAGQPLADPRLSVVQADVVDAIAEAERRYDAILLDVDNGPSAITTEGNGWLYTDSGLAATKRALKDSGTLAVWSAQEDRRFEQRLKHAGFALAVERVRARLKKGGPHHVIFVGRLAGAAASRPR